MGISFENYPIEPQPAFENVSILYNTKCTWMRTSPKQANARIDAVYDSFSDYKISAITTEPSAAATQQKIYDQLPPDSLLFVATGDSGPSLAARALVRHTREDADNINRYTMVADHFGSTSDFAHAMYEDPANTNPRDLVFGENVRRVGLFPLQVEVELPDSTVERDIVAGYVGFGLSGEAIRVLNSEAHRNSWGYRFKPTRQLMKYMAVWQGLRNTQPFTIQEHNCGPGQDRHLVEYAIYNTGVASEHGRPPVHAEERRFFSTQADTKALRPIVKKMFELKNGTIDGNYHEYRERIVFHTWSPVAMQKDGELCDLPRDSRVRIFMHDHPYAALTNKPGPADPNRYQ